MEFFKCVPPATPAQKVTLGAAVMCTVYSGAIHILQLPQLGGQNQRAEPIVFMVQHQHQQHLHGNGTLNSTVSTFHLAER